MCEKGTMGKTPSGSGGNWITYLVLGTLLAIPLCGGQADAGVPSRTAINSTSADTVNIMREAEAGVENARRLLPVGKKLMLQALRDCQQQMGVYDSDLDA